MSNIEDILSKYFGPVLEDRVKLCAKEIKSNLGTGKTEPMSVRGALQEIANQDDFEMALDPQWAKRIALVALGEGVKEAVVIDAHQVCTWKLGEYGDEPWVSDCGLAWTLPSGTPKENAMRFCPGCGKPLAALGERGA